MPALLAFDGAGFFDTVRGHAEWRDARLWGADPATGGNLQYVVMDAWFYNLRIWDRGGRQGSFMEIAREFVESNPNIAVLTNGQFFDIPHIFNPCGGTEVGDPIGGTVDDGVYRPGWSPVPENRDIWAEERQTFCQYRGRGAPSFAVFQGRPNGSGCRSGMGGALALLTGTRRARQAQMFGTYGLSERIAKTCLGIHRTSNCVFVAVDCGESMSIEDLLNKLADMGVEDAVLFDSSTSPAIIIQDGAGSHGFGPANAWCRDPQIPNGPYFIYSALFVRSILAFTPGDPAFGTATAYDLQDHVIASITSGLVGYITPIAGGHQLTLRHLGSGPSAGSDDVLANAVYLHTAFSRARGVIEAAATAGHSDFDFNREGWSMHLERADAAHGGCFKGTVRLRPPLLGPPLPELEVDFNVIINVD